MFLGMLCTLKMMLPLQIAWSNKANKTRKTKAVTLNVLKMKTASEQLFARGKSKKCDERFSFGYI